MGDSSISIEYDENAPIAKKNVEFRRWLLAHLWPVCQILKLLQLKTSQLWMAIKGNMTNNKAYMVNLLIIAISLTLNPFSSGTHVGENSISIDYDENASKTKKKA